MRNPRLAYLVYSPQNVVSLATAKCQAGGMITARGVDEVKQEVADKKVSRAREDKAR